MISLFFLAVAALPGVPSVSGAALAPDTIGHLKGRPAVLSHSERKPHKMVRATCHPDPHKGRICRQRRARAEDARQEALVRRDAEGMTVRENAR